MTVTQTPNKGLNITTVGSELDTWGPFMDANMSILDSALGATATIALTNLPVTLSTAQYQNYFLTFTGAITANITVTFPSIGSIYTVQNLTSNTSNFNVTLATTVSSGQHIAMPWAEAIDVINDGVNIKFRSLHQPIGSYTRIASTAVPSWIAACSVPPYLKCDGSVFSSATYPILANTMRTTTLPDIRGRAMWTIDPLGLKGVLGSGNIFSIGLAPNIGADSVTIPASAMPIQIGAQVTDASLGAGTYFSVNTPGVGAAYENIPPLIVAGMTLVRAG